MLISLGLLHETFSSLALMLTTTRFSGAAVGTGKKQQQIQTSSSESHAVPNMVVLALDCRDNHPQFKKIMHDQPRFPRIQYNPTRFAYNNVCGQYYI